MKHFLGLLGVLAGLAAPLVAEADQPSRVIIKGESTPKWLVHTETIGQGERQATYYYTNIVLTGSHMPTVIRRYKGRLQIVSGAPINGRAFSSSVASTFIGLDPALTP